MKEFDPNKIYIENRDGISATNPIIPRRYTLTHSDLTGDLFITTGNDYAYDKTSYLRDEVYGEWVMENEQYRMNLYILLDGSNSDQTMRRNVIFRQELPYAIQALGYANRDLFKYYPLLETAPIYIYFLSNDPSFNKVEDWGSFLSYSTYNQ